MFFSGSTYQDSYYAATASASSIPRPPLQGDMEADVVVVGGGFTGLYTALNLARAGRQVVVLEASRVGWGASGRNGGQLILGFGTEMAQLKQSLGHTNAKNLWNLSREAAQAIRTLITEHQIDADYVAGQLTVSVLPQRTPWLQHWMQEAATDWGYDRLQFIDKAALPGHVQSERYQAAVFDPEGGHIHPLKYVLGLARVAESLGVQILEGSKAGAWTLDARGVQVQTANGNVRAQQLVLATNAYTDALDARISARVLPVGTYVIATEPLGEARARALLPSNACVIDNQFVPDYFRLSADHRLIFGGKCTYTGREPRNVREGMRQDMLRVFPDLKDVRVDYSWGGHIDITARRMPMWGRQDERVFWAMGFCGHGIVPTCAAATVLGEAMGGNTQRLDWMQSIVNPPFPGGKTFAGLFQAAGMAYYRAKDYSGSLSSML